MKRVPVKAQFNSELMYRLRTIQLDNTFSIRKEPKLIVVYENNIEVSVYYTRGMVRIVRFDLTTADRLTNVIDFSGRTYAGIVSLIIQLLE